MQNSKNNVHLHYEILPADNNTPLSIPCAAFLHKTARYVSGARRLPRHCDTDDTTARQCIGYLAE
ncbi:MAG: hypothetical protein PHU62_10370, partial [Bacteroidales bacterium]|nr:hypothetical protein [Bacteroidales bacterium]MDD3915297.1 hypothetical protein [Bacteroidales bacterium]MDD4634952.1 hypothetical protein [Bacteroidales bacterium]